jgi:hypothetical protein
MFAPFGADGFYLVTHAGTAVSVAEGEAMASRNSPDVDVIKSAERIVYQEKWRICEERAAAHLATTSSLRWTRLFPESAVIRVVAIEGVVIGQVRRHRGRWVATGAGRRGQVGDCDTFQTAVWALVCSAALRSAVPMIDPKTAVKQRFPVCEGDCHDAN